jgi:hypothetical protein
VQILVECKFLLKNTVIFLQLGAHDAIEVDFTLSFVLTHWLQRFMQLIDQSPVSGEPYVGPLEVSSTHAPVFAISPN